MRGRLSILIYTEICVCISLRLRDGVIRQVNTSITPCELPEADRILTLWSMKPLSFHFKAFCHLKYLVCYFRNIGMHVRAIECVHAQVSTVKQFLMSLHRAETAETNSAEKLVSMRNSDNISTETCGCSSVTKMSRPNGTSDDFLQTCINVANTRQNQTIFSEKLLVRIQKQWPSFTSTLRKQE